MTNIQIVDSTGHLGEERLPTPLILTLLSLETALIAIVIFDPLMFILVVAALVVLLIILVKPIYGLYLSTVIAYSGAASSLLQGLFMPVIAVTALAWLGSFLYTKTASLMRAKQNVFLILLGSLMLVSTIWASNIELSLAANYEFLKYALFYFLVIHLIDSIQAFRGMVWVLVVTGILMFLYGVYLSVFSTTIVTSTRMTSFIEDPNSYAIKLVPLVALAYTLIKTEHKRLLRLLAMGILGILFGAVTLSFSRGGLLGLFAVIVLIGLEEIRNKKALIVLVLFLAVAYLAIPKELAFFSRFRSFEQVTMDASIVQRLRVLQGGIQMFLDNPILGVGAGNFIVHSKDYANTNFPLVAHNSYLHVAAELGIMGIILFLTLLMKTLVELRACRLSLERRLHTLYHFLFGLQVAISGFMVHALFLSEHHNIALFILLGLAVVLIHLARTHANEHSLQEA